jgi:hypothetical protein
LWRGWRADGASNGDAEDGEEEDDLGEHVEGLGFWLEVLVEKGVLVVVESDCGSDD